MAGHIALDKYGQLSERRYTEFQVTGLQRPDRPDWHVSGNRNLEDQPVSMSLYQDEDNGLLVADIQLYESWLKRLPMWQGGS